MSARRARVVVAYATVKLLDPATGKWTVRGFHRDAVFPESADPDNVAALVRREYAEWIDEAVVEAPDVATEAPVEALDEDAEPAPPQSAPKADWVAYAVTQGADQDGAEAKTKADLIAEFGG